jgi:hypothetical protein
MVSITSLSKLEARSIIRYLAASRMPRGIEMKNPSSLTGNHEETVQHSKGERRHSEKVHRCDGVAMVAQQRRPSSSRWGIPGGFAHPAQDSALGGIETKHLQFAMNAWSTSGRIFSHHGEDELTDFLARRPSHTRTSDREIHFQYQLSLARCQHKTVSGWTKIRAVCHPDHRRLEIFVLACTT